MDKDSIQKFIEQYDWKGLAERYRNSEVALAAEEWQNLFTFMREQGQTKIREDIKVVVDLILNDVLDAKFGTKNRAELILRLENIKKL